MADQQRATVEGIVVRVKGDQTAFSLNHADNWINLSRWLDPGTRCPQVGDHVTVALDPRGYARAVLLQTPRAVVTGPSNANLGGGSPEVASGPISQRDQLILRQVALKCAVELCCANPEWRTGAKALAVAERFAAWLALHNPSDRQGEDSSGEAVN